MENLGYESHNAVINLGSMAIFFTLYFVKIIIFMFVKLYKKCAKGRYGSTSLYNWFHKTLFFREILNIMFEGYMEFLIAGYLNYKGRFDTFNGEIAG